MILLNLICQFEKFNLRKVSYQCAFKDLHLQAALLQNYSWQARREGSEAGGENKGGSSERMEGGRFPNNSFKLEELEQSSTEILYSLYKLCWRRTCNSWKMFLNSDK